MEQAREETDAGTVRRLGFCFSWTLMSELTESFKRIEQFVEEDQGHENFTRQEGGREARREEGAEAQKGFKRSERNESKQRMNETNKERISVFRYRQNRARAVSVCHICVGVFENRTQKDREA